MTTQAIEQLHHRAAKLVLSAADATTSKSHIAAALTHAVSARADPPVIHDLQIAFTALDRVTRRAELQRLRLLRKAARKGATP